MSLSVPSIAIITNKHAITSKQSDSTPDLDDAMAEAQPYAPALRSFIATGGRYIGFCLGAYMAGHDPGFSLLPPSDAVSQEIEAPNAQVTTEEDAIVQVDWTFSTGKKAGQTEAKRWVYFQDGPMFSVAEGSAARVLARYSSSGDVAAVVCRFGEGWVAGVGPHPEADGDWCEFLSFFSSGDLFGVEEWMGMFG